MAGELVFADGQLEYNGYLLGDDDVTFMESLTGWDDLPAVDSGNALRPSSHGAWSGIKLLGERIITWSGRFAPSKANWNAEMVRLRNAFLVPFDENEIQITVRMRDETLIALGALTNRALPGDYSYSAYGAHLTLQWECADPNKYGTVLKNNAIGLQGITTDGLIYPLVYPLSYGTPRTPSTGSVTNNGNIEAPIKVYFRGPLNNPSLINETTNRKLRFVISLSDTDILSVDTRTGAVLLNNTVDRLYTRDTTSSPIRLFTVQPGDNSMRFSAESYSVGAQVAFEWRDAVV
jgi:hypothetical protein